MKGGGEEKLQYSTGIKLKIRSAPRKGKKKKKLQKWNETKI